LKRSIKDWGINLLSFIHTGKVRIYKPELGGENNENSLGLPQIS
jgi:hypothetical protein